MRTQLTNHARDDRGAFGLLFGVLLGTGVLFGLVALSFDYGMVNVDHSQLQSSADATALKAAQLCVTQNVCPDQGDSRLAALSQANDSGSKYGSSVWLLCGSAPDLNGPPDACPGFNDARITTCPPPTIDGDAWAGDYVDVYTTKQTDHVFAGDGSTQGHACAAVAWGPVADYTADLPITFSYCEWKNDVGGDPFTGEGSTYAPSPPYPPYPDGQAIIYLNKPNEDTGSCPNWNGHDDPGGFGWLDGGASGCSQAVSVDDWVHVDTGNNTPNACAAALNNMLGTVIHVPVFDCQSRTQSYPDPLSDCVTGGNGSNHYYHIVSFAAFYVTGWHLSGSSHDSIATGGAPCSGGDRCISGFFVKDVVHGAPQPPGGDTPYFGLTAIQTIG